MKGMKRFLFLAVLILVLMVPAHHARAQTTSAGGTTVTPKVFDTTGFPQWAKDLRRWEIVAFGSFPFTMFASTFAMDTRRWIDANGMDFTEDGRRYAPWPFKSAGAISMTSREVETSLLIAAGLSVAIACTDLLIVQLKRHKERRRAENMPRGNVIINTSPWPEGSTIKDDADAGGAPGGENVPEVPAVP